jgi:hypothetical protein
MNKTMTQSNFLVLTTINPINSSIKKMIDETDFRLIIVGDKKTPKYSKGNFEFLDIDKQKTLPFKFVETCPYNSYQRKNLGYLYAIKEGAEIIVETDDDNYPLSGWTRNIEFIPKNSKLVLEPKIFNAYAEFTKEKIWPRGFPLECILENKEKKFEQIKNPSIGIWQGLVNNEPDVDAIYRLTINKNIEFLNNESIVLSKGVFCPFNSQNTIWKKEFFPYMYLPVTVTFRMTDILRSYVAQRCLWEHESFLAFTGPTMAQERNPHNLIEDFKSEIPCYTYSLKIIEILSDLQLSSNPYSNLEIIYAEFAKNGIVENNELLSLQNWINDLRNLL